MGILDEAIREHLELKRQHGAGESELKQLEDEAFGAPGRPGDEEEPRDELAEAPTEFMAQPEVEEPREPAEDRPELPGEQEQELPPAPASRRREPATEISGLQEAPEEGEREEPADEEAPAMEHEAIRPEEIDAQSLPEPEPEPEPEPQPEREEPSLGPSTEERQAIAEQPTELYDVEGAEGIENTGAAEAELDEEEDDDFFDEKRLSDELDQALETGGEPDQESGAEPDEEPAVTDDREDLLEETPDFLEEAPEDDRLWFEQRPPKDFDFDD